jgi:hypothetical protein
MHLSVSNILLLREEREESGEREMEGETKSEQRADKQRRTSKDIQTTRHDLHFSTFCALFSKCCLYEPPNDKHHRTTGPLVRGTYAMAISSQHSITCCYVNWVFVHRIVFIFMFIASVRVVHLVLCCTVYSAHSTSALTSNRRE